MTKETNQPISICFELFRSSKKKNLRSGNEMINANDKIHFHVRNELTDHLKTLASTEARQYVGDSHDYNPIFTKENPCFIIVRVAPPTNRKMDTPNWYPTAKALVDGLTSMGMFEDDNDNVITSFTFVRNPKTKNKKYQIILDIYPGSIGGIINA